MTHKSQTPDLTITHLYMQSLILKFMLVGIVVGACYATFGIWLMWSDDPEFHSGTVAGPSHILWITNYSVEYDDIIKTLSLYATCIFYGAASFLVAGAITQFLINKWKRSRNVLG